MSEIIKTKMSAIGYIADRNYSRPTGVLSVERKDQQDLIQAMHKGWLDDTCAYLKVLAITPEDAKIVMAARQERLDALKKAVDENVKETKYVIDGELVTASPAERLRAFEKTFMADGKIIKPKYEGVFGFRRNHVVLDANVIASKRSMPGFYDVKVQVQSYTDPQDRKDTCIKENTLKVLGAKAPSKTDFLLIGKTLYQKCYGGTKIGETLGISKRGQRQDMHAILKLDGDWKSLKIVDRIVKGDLNLKGLGYKKIKAFYDATPNVKIEDVEAFITKPDVEVPKSMSRKDMEQVVAQHPDQVVVDVIKLVLDNNPDGLGEYRV